MKKILILFSTFLVAQLSFAQINSSFFTKADTFFKEHVSNGLVNYANIKANPSSLNELLKDIESAKPQKSNSDEFKAFYINSYNLLVIKGIVNKYPVKRPIDINGFFDSKKYLVAGRQITLNGIENDILRKSYPKEARFHFALVCAGLGCPPLIPEAYTPGKLDSQLQRQTIKAINDIAFTKVDGKRVTISQIFEWYAKDFKQFGSYIDFLNQYRKSPLDPKSKISFYPYDWTLNDLK